MKKVIFQMSVSLDGYIEGPNREIDWHLVDDDFNAYAAEMLKASDVLIMGRKTYELMAGYWPTAADNDPVLKEERHAQAGIFEDAEEGRVAEFALGRGLHCRRGGALEAGSRRRCGPSGRK
jgi:hypothetical protein